MKNMAITLKNRCAKMAAVAAVGSITIMSAAPASAEWYTSQHWQNFQTLAGVGQDKGCLSYTSVYQTVAAALADWAVSGTDAFCDAPVELARSSGTTFSLSGTGLPSNYKCMREAGLIMGNGTALAPVKQGTITVTNRWRLQRRGQTHKVGCSFNYTIID